MFLHNKNKQEEEKENREEKGAYQAPNFEFPSLPLMSIVPVSINLVTFFTRDQGLVIKGYECK